MQPIPSPELADASIWERPALASGIVFAVLQLVVMAVFAAFILPALGDIDGTVAQRAAGYVEHADLLRLGNYLLTLPVGFFLLFLGGLYGVLRRAEGGSGAFAMAAVLAGAALAMLWPLAAVISGIGILIAQHGGDPATVWALDAIGPYMLALSAVPRAVLLAAASAVLLRSGVGRRWIGGSGLAVGTLSLLGSATLLSGAAFPLLALSTLLFEFWLIALCIDLLRLAPASGGAARRFATERRASLAAAGSGRA